MGDTPHRGQLPYEEDPPGFGLTLTVGRRKQPCISGIWYHLEASANAVILNRVLKRVAYRKNHICPAECQPCFEDVQPAQQLSGKGGKVFTNYDWNTVKFTNQNSSPAGIIYMSMDNVRRKPLHNY